MKANPLSLVARLASSIENLPARAILFLFVLVIWVLAGQSAWAQIVGTASLNVERRGHTSTQLFDGKVLVVGGENLSGSVSQAEIFDQASQAFSVVGNHRPRTDHTATRLADGRVLVAGGRDSYGFLDDVEIFNPTTNSFSPAPSMKRARGGHSATVLADGKILLVGGDVEGSAEMYDPDTQSFSLLSGRLSAPRSLHAAILLQDGRVLVAGGVDFGNAVLSSAELFYPFMEMFFLTINTMQTTRGLPLLRVLPDGKVQVIGGDAAFSMEMFDPSTDTFIALAYLPPTADLLSATLSTHSRSALISPDVSQHPLLQGTLSNEISDFLNRADHSITELTQSNRALVAGGVNGEGQVLSSAVLVKSSAATITTDKTDYAPGEVVTITGRGWKPNETISIVVHEDPEAYSDTVISAAVDSNGNFVNTQFSPAPIDFGRVFTLTAFGLSSGFAAQTAFRDALSINSVTLTAGSTTVPPGALTVAPGASITATLSVTTSTGGGSNN
jgi:hypothetical protein